jgi:hypothetical protein
MRILRALALLAAALPTAGCFQVSTLVSVTGSGAGTITQRVVFSAGALAQVRQFAALASGGLTQNVEAVSEQQARDAADRMGEGVTYVSSTPIATAEGEGRESVYAFTDINRVRLEPQPPAPGGFAGAQGLAGDVGRLTFTHARQADGRALLRVTVPQVVLTRNNRTGRPAGALPSPDQLAQVRPIVAGARLAIAVEPAGALVRTNSAYVDGRRVTVLDVDVDQLLSDTTLARLRTAQTSEEARAALADSPGVKINFESKLTIEFTPTVN